MTRDDLPMELLSQESESRAMAGVPGAVRGGDGTRVRFARGIAEVPGDRAVVVLPDDAILRWRPLSKRPAGAASAIGEVAVGATIAVDYGGLWEEGIVLGRVVRPTRGGFQVDGDVAEYRSADEAALEHGPLTLGEPQEGAARDGAPAIETGEPLARDDRAVLRSMRRSP